jgi:hypothetical protein
MLTDALQTGIAYVVAHFRLKSRYQPASTRAALQKKIVHARD